jgi:hypothetical protein
MSITPVYVLILGSYDGDTKRLIYELKEEVSKRHGRNDVYSLVLDKVEIFDCDNAIQVITELYESTLTLMIFRGTELVDIDEIANVTEPQIEEKAMTHLNSHHGSKRVQKFTVLNKLDLLMRFSASICVIREKELTRGGEYCELVHALARDYEKKIVFLYNKNVTLSGMLKEYLDGFKVAMRAYSDTEPFIDEAMRFIEYRIYPVNI